EGSGVEELRLSQRVAAPRARAGRLSLWGAAEGRRPAFGKRVDAGRSFAGPARGRATADDGLPRSVQLVLLDLVAECPRGKLEKFGRARTVARGTFERAGDQLPFEGRQPPLH